jgi:hypothetical protein
MSFYPGPRTKITNCRHFDNIYFFKFPCVTNITLHSKHYRKHAVMHLEVNASMLNRFIFTLCYFRPVLPIISLNTFL